MSVIGARLGPYEIVAPLGAGGMGEVYRARDTRLGRDVAIKVLPVEFAGDPDRLRRFEQEARAIAALNHPHILAIHDIGTHQGAPYIVTELLDGDSLRDRLHGAALPASKAVEIAVQIAQGLAAAHEKGIVHRDLKPGNVFVTKDGHVKILDFGLAKLAHADATPDPYARTASGEPSTESGAVLGTMGYMSPEQLRGQPADARSDIFSFGCVLYEMLSGKAPFLKRTGPETASAILTEDPAPLSASGRPVAPGLQEIVSRCLEKRAEERFSSAHDLALALRAVAGGVEAPGAAQVTLATAPSSRRRATWLVLAGVALLAVLGALVFKLRAGAPGMRAGALKKIVVLPFENLGAPEDAYFASGMTEEITSRLANVQGLGVISRTTAAQFEHTRETVKQIGSDLGVDYLLEGSVRWEHEPGKESRVRITPQLIRVADDTHVWADRYDRVLADVFAIQSEVAESVVKAMGIALVPREQTALKEISTNDLEAYRLYLLGLEADRGGLGRQDVTAALQSYQAAVDRDPRFAQALAGLAEGHLETYFLYYDRSPERVVRAREAAERAVELRPDLAETHVALGWYYYQGALDYARALEEFAAALKIEPSSSTAHEGTGLVMRRQGRWAQSAEELSKALDLDPKNAALLRLFAESCMLARRYADADGAFRLATRLNPREAGPRAPEAWLQVVWHGDVGKAQAILDEAGSVAGLLDDERGLAWVSIRVAMARRAYEGALRLLEASSDRAFDSQWRYVPISLLRGEAQVLAGWNEPARRSFDAARLELEQRVRQDPGDARYRSSLGIACAGLGRRPEAIREARLGCDLMAASKDAWRALYRLEDLGRVYTMTGRYDEAIAALDELLSRSGSMTPHVLRMDPVWDPLRSDPRFQALLTKYEVKE